MNAEERTPVRSTRTPKRIGGTKPPRPPISPTMPEITPMSSGYSSEMYLNTEALPNAQATPTMNSRAVNIQAFRPMLNRSEEHTSELQSRENLVCRLLLEKKRQ